MLLKEAHAAMGKPMPEFACSGITMNHANGTCRNPHDHSLDRRLLGRLGRRDRCEDCAGVHHGGYGGSTRNPATVRQL